MKNTTPEDSEVPRVHPKTDPALEFLVILAEGIEKQAQSDGENRGVGITLFVSGLIISGEMISHTKYQTLAFDGAFEKMRQKMSKEDRDEMDSEQTSPIERNFIHLQRAQIFHHSGNPIPAIGGFLWRGKISSVDAFTQGKLEQAKT